MSFGLSRLLPKFGARKYCMGPGVLRWSACGSLGQYELQLSFAYAPATRGKLPCIAWALSFVYLLYTLRRAEGTRAEEMLGIGSTIVSPCPCSRVPGFSRC